MGYTQFAEFRDKIAALPAAMSYDRQTLLVDDFLLAKDDRTKVYYAPFDHVNTSARLAIVGLTPGWTQMNVSFVEARKAIDDGATDAQILKRAKRGAAFSGAMRTNLLLMLDDLGVPGALGIDRTAELFEASGEDLVHSTSALRYPVFINGKNYSGHPPAANEVLLLPYFDLLDSELASLDGALIVPLGKAVQGILDHLVAAKQLDPSRTLTGFPHPSGANAHRARQFHENRASMTHVVRRWSR